MRLCDIEDCGRRHKGRGLCSKHLQRLRANGHTEGRELRPEHWGTLYRRWWQMHNRCENPKDAAYHRYGARGIFVSEQWDTPQKFYEWAVPNGFQPHLTLDRIDNDKEHSPDNCRWATRQEQVDNRQCSMRLGGSLLTDLCKQRGVSAKIARRRMHRGETDIERILSPTHLFDTRKRDSTGKFIRREGSTDG